MERISQQQLFAIVIMEQIGSTGLWALGIDAGRDAWLTILLSMLTGLGFVWIFIDLQKQFPDENTAGLMTGVLGKAIGWPLALLYTAEDIFNATRNSSEFTGLLNVTFLQYTPAKVILLIFLATIIYISFTGVENFARMAEMLMLFTTLAIIIFYLFILTSGQVDLQELTPVLENGPMPVLKAAFPTVVNFPFGMAFIFMQFWHFTDPQKSIRKITFSAMTLTGTILCFTLMVIVSTLGTLRAKHATIPVLEVLKLTNINDMIINPDVLAILNIFVGGFFMTAIHLLSAAMVLASLFRIKDYRWTIVPITVFIFWYSGVYEPDYLFHVQFLPIQAWQQFVPFYNLIPILLLLIFWLKKHCGKLARVRRSRRSRSGA